MARKRYEPEEIVILLRQAEVLHGQGGLPRMATPGSVTLRRPPSLAEKPAMH